MSDHTRTAFLYIVCAVLACAILYVLFRFVISFRPAEATVYSIRGQYATAAPLTDADKAQRINLNTASKEDLMTLPGIGTKTAQAILDLRSELGTFRYIEELLHVRGIGEKKLLSIYDLVYVE